MFGRICGFALLALFGFMALCGSVYAQDWESLQSEKKIAVGGVLAGVFPSDDDIDNNLYWGGIATYDIIKYAAIGFEGGYMKWEDKINSTKYGDVTGIPLLGDIILKYPFEVEDFEITPYGILGMGVVLWDYDEASILETNGISVDMDNSFAIKFGGGADFYFTENMGVFLEGSYIWSDTDATAAARGTAVSVSLDTDMWMLLTGIKFRF